MEKEKMDCCSNKKIVVKGCHHGHGESSAIYGLGVIGSLFYFLQGAVGFGPIVMGIGKAVFWPALVVYKALEMLRI